MNPKNSTASGLRLIHGGGRDIPAWANLPSTVLGRSPFEKSEAMIFRLAKHDLVRQLEAGRRQPVYEAWGSIIGKVPPVPNASRLHERLQRTPLLSLKDAHACFRGLKRPIGDDPRGFHHVAYILKPDLMISYRPHMVCLAHLDEVPRDVVFAIYCKMDYPVERGNLWTQGRHPTSGVITHWGFIEADPIDPLMPVGYDARYRKQMW